MVKHVLNSAARVSQPARNLRLFLHTGDVRGAIPPDFREQECVETRPWCGGPWLCDTGYLRLHNFSPRLEVSFLQASSPSLPGAAAAAYAAAGTPDFYLLRRFLRARSYDMEKATAMWMNNVDFKKEFNVDTILEDFVFEERSPFLEAYPQGYHKCDKLVSA